MNTKNFLEDSIFNYYIIFGKQSYTDSFMSIVQNCLYKDYDTLHLWDSEISPVLDAFGYVLQLPRLILDVIEYSYREYLYCHDSAHNIKLIPFCKTSPEKQPEINKYIYKPTLIICPDNLYEELIKLPEANSSLLGVCKISELNTELLHNHWRKLAKYAVDKNFCKSGKVKLLNSKYELAAQEKRKIIPILQLANQLDYVEDILNVDISDILKVTKNINNNVMYVCYKVLENDEEFRKSYKKFPLRKLKPELPVIISMPGTVNFQINRYGRRPDLSEIEKEVISLMALHRAAAKNGIHLELPLNEVTSKMFDELLKLEEHCVNAKNISNKFIWRTLRRIGRLFANLLKADKNIDILKDPSHITVFSDFPIGLAILPGCTSPLCCIKPLSYRPLTPLTRAFQREMPKIPQICMTDTIKIIYAECVGKEDLIRDNCDVLSEFLINNFSKYKLEFIYKETTSVGAFKAFIKNNKADILIVSAHGKYCAKQNKTELCIGSETWMADDNDLNVPPVVILSACTTSPRGRGVVSVADMFYRAGAVAVLSSLIPINVSRNANLLVRLFTYIIEAQNNFLGLFTLDQVWQHVVATNAIHEILSGSKSLEKWANTKDAGVKTPQERFKLEYSQQKLSPGNIYQDTENILIEMARQDNFEDPLKNYFQSQSYFPESVFYQWIGSPENIFLYNPFFKE